ncbi:hypothetical protein F0224_22985 [Vibrio coralliilyticus]|uniref:hypothetical protein n=1 Tax=Vibrio TaxID=662 RepID=UPI000BAC23CD|nr:MULTISPECIES: hypothetical protein [Vibrio]MCY9864353.1 hypothetical protein [Vibrio coralliirubri]NOI78524.1 hypothetical protein [Vibrio coralliilyticus]PAW00863.1 hypothetical protein CKJ79_24455 [Vibrio coralliilyticus]
MFSKEANDFKQQVCDGDVVEAISLLSDLQQLITENFAILKTEPLPTEKLIGTELHKLSGATGLMGLKSLNVFLRYQQDLLDSGKMNINLDYIGGIQERCIQMVEHYKKIIINGSGNIYY